VLYKEEYKEDMVERLKKETGGLLKKNYGKWVDALVEFNRDESQVQSDHPDTNPLYPYGMPSSV
jgi:hypothetical protein